MGREENSGEGKYGKNPNAIKQNRTEQREA